MLHSGFFIETVKHLQLAVKWQFLYIAVSKRVVYCIEHVMLCYGAEHRREIQEVMCYFILLKEWSMNKLQ